MEITLEQLLGARDARYARQLSLTEAWPDRTLVCLTVVLPGPVKRDARSLKVAKAAVKAVQEELNQVCLHLISSFPKSRRRWPRPAA